MTNYKNRVYDEKNLNKNYEERFNVLIFWIHNTNFLKEYFRDSYMSKIEIHYGNPNTEKEWGWVEKFSDNFNIRVEAAIIKNFNISFKTHYDLDESGRNYFELIISIIQVSVWL